MQRCRVGLEDGPARRWKPGDGVGAELIGATRIAAGVNHALAVAGGVLYAWGARKYGQLGDTVQKQRAVPMPVRSHPLVPLACSLDGVTVVDCAAGNAFSLAVDADGGVHAAGTNRSGAMGLGGPPFFVSVAQRFQRVPIGDEDVRWAAEIFDRSDLSSNEVDALWGRGGRHEKVVSVACGASHAICRTADGRVYTWGGVYLSAYLALGHGVESNVEAQQRARLVPGIGNAVHVAAGGTREGVASTLIVRADGTVLLASNETNLFTAAGGAAAPDPTPAQLEQLGSFLELRPAIPRAD